MSSLHDLLASGGLGLCAGLLSGLLGLGGAAVLPPLLHLLLGFEQHRAQAISLAALLPPVTLPAVLQYRRYRVPIHVALTAWLMLGFLVGGSCGAWLAHRLPTRGLGQLFALFLFFSAWRALVVSADAEHEEAQAIFPPDHRPRVAIPIGLLAGCVSGLFGVGGGIVVLPLLRRFAGMPRLEAQVTTLAMMLPPIGLPAVYVYAVEQGGMPWGILGAVACGFAGGALMGARVAPHLSARMSGRLYAVIVSVIAVTMLVRV